MILDEINLAVASGLIDVKDVLELLENIPEETDVVLTGRFAPPELINRADIVNFVVDVKYPKQMYNRIGINY